MSKYCGNCGAMANDNDRICGNCGAPLPNAPAAPAAPPAEPAPNYGTPGYGAPGYGAPGYGTPNYNAQAPSASVDPLADGTAQAPKKGLAAMKAKFKNMNKQDLLKYGGICAGALVILIVIIALLSALAGGSGYKKAVKKYMQAIQKDSPSKMASVLYLPKSMKAKDVAEEAVEEARNYFEDKLDSDKYKIKYEILDAEKMDKDTLEEWKDDLDSTNAFGSDYGYSNVSSIRKGVIVYVKMTASKGSKRVVEYTELYLFKVSGKWKIIGGF